MSAFIVLLFSILAKPPALALTISQVDLDLPLIQSTNPIQLKNRDYIVLDFWASWCSPCKSSFPFFKKESTQWGAQSVQFIGVNLDTQTTEAEVFLKENGHNFPHLIDRDQKLATKLEVQSVPQTLILDKNFNLIKRFRGFDDKIETEMKSFFKSTFSRRTK